MALTNVKIYLTHDQMTLETNQYRIEFEIPIEGIVAVEIDHGTLHISVIPAETPSSPSDNSPYEPEDSDNNGGPENANQT